MTQETERGKLIKSLRIKADMIRMGERITWGSETELMYQAADALEALQGQARASLGKGEAKPVEVWELATVISDAVHDKPFSILSEKSHLTAEQERKRASAILSRYNVTKKESV